MAGDVWRDRDKRMSSGRRFVRVVGFSFKDGRERAICVGCYEASPGVFVDYVKRETKLDSTKMLKRWEFVAAAPPGGQGEPR